MIARDFCMGLPPRDGSSKFKIDRQISDGLSVGIFSFRPEMAEKKKGRFIGRNAKSGRPSCQVVARYVPRLWTQGPTLKPDFPIELATSTPTSTKARTLTGPPILRC